MVVRKGPIHAIVLASGWRRALIAFAAGAASTLALAPTDIWPILFLTLPVLVWLIDGVAARGCAGAWLAAATGWWFGFGYFFVGLYWIGHAFLVDAQIFGWLLPIVIVALPAALAIGTGLVTALYLGLNMIFIYSTPIKDLKGVVAVGDVAAHNLFGQQGANIFGG